MGVRETGRINEGSESVPGFDDSRATLSTLFRQLADDTSELIRRETQLARLELKETASTLARQALWLGIAAVLAVGGGLALTACVVLVLGLLFGGLFWLGALVTGIVFMGLAALIAIRAVRRMSREQLKPEETIGTLTEDARFARREVNDFRRDLMS
jgi:uncharacterized membrane protein YqjE